MSSNGFLNKVTLATLRAKLGWESVTGELQRSEEIGENKISSSGLSEVFVEDKHVAYGINVVHVFWEGEYEFNANEKDGAT